MRLNDARFCCECEEVFEGIVCPKCGQSMCSVHLSDWLMSLNAKRKEQGAERKTTPDAMPYAPCAEAVASGSESAPARRAS